MGRAPQLQLPLAPTYQQNPNLGPNIDYGSQYNRGLLSGDFTGDRSWLSPLVNTNTSQQALQYAQGILQPQFRDTLQQINNNAANNNQLNSSTYTDALARSQSDLNSQYQSIVSQGAINDAYQNNANRLNILGQGEQGLQGFTGLAQNQTNSQNDFNLNNYNNQVASAIQQNQNDRNPGFFGNLLSSVSPVANSIYSAGGYNVPGMGLEQTALIAASLFGGGGLSGGQGLSSGGNSGNTWGTNGGYNSIYGGGLGGVRPGSSAYSQSTLWGQNPWQ